MPLYQYKCSNCKEEFEAFSSMAARDEPQKCKYCYSEEAYHVITPTHFVLEGVSGDFPTAYDQWAKKRKEKMAQEQKQESSE